MDDQLAGYLPETSNILRFQGRFGTFTDRERADWAALENLFHRRYEGKNVPSELLDELPQDSTLQRAVVSHLRGGGCHWYNQTGWILPNTLPAVPGPSGVPSDLREIDCPTMIVLCSEPEGLDAGTWTTRRLALCEYLAEHHPDVRVEWMPTSHMPLLTMAEQTAALIRQFTSASIRGSN